MNPILAPVNDLPASARFVWRELVLMARRRKTLTLWTGNGGLADMTGFAERTVGAALQALKLAGLIDVVRDYTLKVRRVIRLLVDPDTLERVPWTDPAPPAEVPATGLEPPPSNAQVMADKCRQVEARFAASLPPPLTIPLIGTEVERDTLDFVVHPPSSVPPPAAAAPPVARTTTPGDFLSSWEDRIPEKYRPRLDGSRKATPREWAWVDRVARLLFGRTPWTTTQVRALAVRYGIHALSCALESALRVEERDGKVGWGYVRAVLAGYCREGGPPTPPPPVPIEQFLDSEDRCRYIASLLQLDLEAGPGQAGAVTDAEFCEWLSHHLTAHVEAPNLSWDVVGWKRIRRHMNHPAITGKVRKAITVQMYISGATLQTHLRELDRVIEEAIAGAYWADLP
jgi:hypothetical protein